MAPALEREIRQILNHSGSADAVVAELLLRWQRNLFSPDEQSSVAQFLLNSGRYDPFLTQVRSLLHERRRLPWTQIAEVLIRARVRVDEDDIRAVLEGLTEQGAFEEFLSVREVDAWSKSLRDKRKALEAKRSLALAEKKAALRDRLQFFRSNRMYDEEAATLDQLRALFPEDTEFRIDEEDLQVRWAREVLASRVSLRTDLTDELVAREQRITPEVQSLRDSLVARCLDLATQTPQAAMDLALVLVFMEFYSDALDVLALAPRMPSVDWLRLDLCLLSRQYLLALEEANRLEIEYAGDPDATFNIVYVRARSLWGLGQSAMAIDLMKSIVHVRPHYKSAKSLLCDWTGGDE